MVLFSLLLILISLTSVNAKDYVMNWMDTINFEGKTVTFTNAGRGYTTITIDVNGIQDFVQENQAKIIGGLEITNYGIVSCPTVIMDNRDCSFNIGISNPGVCYEDGSCDYQEIELFPSEGKSFNFRGKTVKIVDASISFAIIEVDGSEITINSPVYPYHDPLTTVGISNGIGLRYFGFGDSWFLYLGENFYNCPSDCPLNKEKDYMTITPFCKNKAKDSYTQEEGVDCGGFCERTCDQECLEDNECKDKCNEISSTIVYRTCYCENSKCIDISDCKQNSDCIQVKNDLCNCKFVSINKDYYEYWNNIYKAMIHTKTCANPCKTVQYSSICENNMCKLTTGTVKDEDTDTIYEFLEQVTKEGGYTIILGDEAPSSDSLAATDIASGIQRYSSGKTVIEAKLASEVTNEDKMILVGNPCDNPLINLSCKNWPYKQGETLIKVDGDNLIIAGTTAEDTRSTAKIVANYRGYSFLKESNIVLVTSSGLEIPTIIAEPRQENEETKEEEIVEEKTGEETVSKSPELTEEEPAIAAEKLVEEKGLFKRVIGGFGNLLKKVWCKILHPFGNERYASCLAG